MENTLNTEILKDNPQFTRLDYDVLFGGQSLWNVHEDKPRALSNSPLQGTRLGIDEISRLLKGEPLCCLDRIVAVIYCPKLTEFLYKQIDSEKLENELEEDPSKHKSFFNDLYDKFSSLDLIAVDPKNEEKLIPLLRSKHYKAHFRIIGGLDLQILPTFKIHKKIDLHKKDDLDEKTKRAFIDEYGNKDQKEKGVIPVEQIQNNPIRLEFNPSKDNLFIAKKVFTWIFKTCSKFMPEGFDPLEHITFNRIDVAVTYPFKICPESCMSSRSKKVHFLDNHNTAYFGMSRSPIQVVVYNKKKEILDNGGETPKGIEELWRIESRIRNRIKASSVNLDTLVDSFCSFGVRYIDLDHIERQTNLSGSEIHFFHSCMLVGFTKALSFFKNKNTKTRYKKMYEINTNCIMSQPHVIVSQHQNLWSDFIESFCELFKTKQNKKLRKEDLKKYIKEN